MVMAPTTCSSRSDTDITGRGFRLKTAEGSSDPVAKGNGPRRLLDQHTTSGLGPGSASPARHDNRRYGALGRSAKPSLSAP